MVAVWKRPSFWTTLVAIIVYWDSRALNGKWVYDDAGSVIKNVVVNGMVDWKEAFSRDFWGTEMKEAQSHKSFRPITTLTLKANYVLAQNYFLPPDWEDKYPPTYTFKVVNVMLHGIVTGLITEATGFLFPLDQGSSMLALQQLLVGFLFGLHPVHAEVVSNVTSRGEMLMSTFFLLAFLSYAYHLKHSQRVSGIQYVVGIYLVPWLGMALSLFSKEQGATSLITLVIYDYVQHHGSVVRLWNDLIVRRDAKAIGFVRRTILLAIQTLLVVYWRFILNGETVPDFIEAQNPAGFAKDRFTRAFSVSWVYCLYIRDALYPKYLCPDWSGVSIDLIKSLSDPRAIIVICLWYFSALSLEYLILGTNFKEEDNNEDEVSRDGTITTAGDIDTAGMQEGCKNHSSSMNAFFAKLNLFVWAFIFTPFLLSSNILVVVGLMKADRVIYLPLFGFCLIEVLILSQFCFKGKVAMPTALNTKRRQEFWFGYFFVIFQFVVFAGITHRRNIVWSDSLLLWGSAYQINPRSHHTMYNYGYELSLKQRYQEAEPVLRPIGDPRVEGPSNTFIYAMVLFNLQRCEEANKLLDAAFEVVEEKRREGGPRNTKNSLDRTESNLLVARAHCAENIRQRGRILYEAVQKDQTNDYAIGLAQNLMERIKAMEQLGVLPD